MVVLISSSCRSFHTQGDTHDHQGLVKAIRQADVVISIVNHTQLTDQLKVISAIKEAGNVKVHQNSKVKFYLLTKFSSVVENIVV